MTENSAARENEHPTDRTEDPGAGWMLIFLRMFSDAVPAALPKEKRARLSALSGIAVDAKLFKTLSAAVDGKSHIQKRNRRDGSCPFSEAHLRSDQRL